MKRGNPGVALVTVIIFVLLLSIIAVAMLTLVANYPLLVQNQIRRTQAQYVAEGAFWQQLMSYASGAQAPPNVLTPITVTVDNIDYTATLSYQAAGVPGGIDLLNATVGY